MGADGTCGAMNITKGSWPGAKNARQKVGLPLQWPILIADFTDGFSFQRCRAIEREVGKEFVQCSTRSISIGRHFVKKTVKTGKLQNLVRDGATFRYV
jgi:hypothetical protein